MFQEDQSQCVQRHVQWRVQQRKDYMERESGRNDGAFFALLFSFFVLPAAVILIVAWQTGYLASLDTNQHF